MRKYEGNMKEYEENMKKCEGNMNPGGEESYADIIPGMAPSTEREGGFPAKKGSDGSWA